MGTLTYKDLLAIYCDLDDKFCTIGEEYALTDAKALPKLSAVLYEVQAFREELENNARWMAACGTPMPADETNELRDDVAILIGDIERSRSRRASIIRENLHDAGL